MMTFKSLAVWVWLLPGLVLAQNASNPAPTPQLGNDTLASFPTCALLCIFEEVGNSPCQTVTNTTCVCNDGKFYKQVEKCVMAGCTPPEGIATQRIKAQFCHDPVRSQVTMLYGLRSLEVAAWCLVLFRFYARWITTTLFGWDDYVMMAVAAIYIPQLVISQLMDDNAFGRDIWDLEFDKVILGMKLFFVQEPLYLLQLGLTKISILFLYLRIFPGRRFKLILYTFMVFVAGTTAVLVGGSMFECLPFGYFWDSWRTEYLVNTKKCINLTLAVFGAAGLSILQDIIMIILPIPPLLKTQLPRKDKIGISIMFILGLLITGASCIRLQYINVAYSPNPFWDFEPALLWSLVELAMSFLVTSLPALRNYYTRILKPKVRAYIETRRSTKASEGTGTGPSGRSGSGSQQPTRSARGAQRRGNSNLISTLAFTQVSWNSFRDRKSKSQTTDDPPLPVHEGQIVAKTAPQISLRDMTASPWPETLTGKDDWEQPTAEERGLAGSIHETKVQETREVEKELDTVNALAWVGRPEVAGTEPRGAPKSDGLPPEASRDTPGPSWPLRDSIV